MTTVADALEIMAVVAACHQRTAPRMDDREVALATAQVWSELFDEFNFTNTELITAVKNRAKICPDAPEVADIIRVARSNRSDRMARTPPTETEPNQPHDEHHHPNDTKAAKDPAAFPTHWTPEQRTTAYWYALRLHAIPHTTAGWEAIAEQLENKQTERAQEPNPPQPTPNEHQNTPPDPDEPPY